MSVPLSWVPWEKHLPTKTFAPPFSPLPSPFPARGLASRWALSIDTDLLHFPDQLVSRITFSFQRMVGGWGRWGRGQAFRHRVPFNLSLNCMLLIIHIMAAAVTQHPWISFQESQLLHLERVMEGTHFTGKILGRFVGEGTGREAHSRVKRVEFHLGMTKKGSHQVITSFHVLHKQLYA